RLQTNCASRPWSFLRRCVASQLPGVLVLVTRAVQLDFVASPRIQAAITRLLTWKVDQQVDDPVFHLVRQTTLRHVVRDSRTCPTFRSPRASDAVLYRSANHPEIGGELRSRTPKPNGHPGFRDQLPSTRRNSPWYPRPDSNQHTRGLSAVPLPDWAKGYLLL